mmetsp:Transcript_6223/g.15797  ORF Transcript_6223/g.15797 Transcript_6223/m.15797 type:complete len:369 (-) Transcript_6223:178-1284(-)
MPHGKGWTTSHPRHQQRSSAFRFSFISRSRATLTASRQRVALGIMHCHPQRPAGYNTRPSLPLAGGPSAGRASTAWRPTTSTSVPCAGSARAPRSMPRSRRCGCLSVMQVEQRQRGPASPGAVVGVMQACSAMAAGYCPSRGRATRVLRSTTTTSAPPATAGLRGAAARFRAWSRPAPVAAAAPGQTARSRSTRSCCCGYGGTSAGSRSPACLAAQSQSPSGRALPPAAALLQRCAPRWAAAQGSPASRRCSSSTRATRGRSWASSGAARWTAPRSTASWCWTRRCRPAGLRGSSPRVRRARERVAGQARSSLGWTSWRRRSTRSCMWTPSRWSPQLRSTVRCGLWRAPSGCSRDQRWDALTRILIYM